MLVVSVVLVLIFLVVWDTTKSWSMETSPSRLVHTGFGFGFTRELPAQLEISFDVFPSWNDAFISCDIYTPDEICVVCCVEP